MCKNYLPKFFDGAFLKCWEQISVVIDQTINLEIYFTYMYFTLNHKFSD